MWTTLESVEGGALHAASRSSYTRTNEIMTTRSLKGGWRIKTWGDKVLYTVASTVATCAGTCAGPGRLGRMVPDMTISL